MLRSAVRGLGRSLGLDIKRYSAFARAVDLLAEQEPKPFFLQIGANNGTDFDDVYASVVRNQLPGIAVEPVAEYYEALTVAYSRHPAVRTVRAAVHPTASEMRMYCVDPAQATKLWHHGLASFSRDHLTRHGVTESAIVEEVVPALSFAALVAEHLPPGRELAVLAVDTEGFDEQVLAMVDFAQHRPQILRFESKHMSGEALARVRSRLSAHGYRVTETGEDCLAVRGGWDRRVRYLRRAPVLGRNA